MKIGNEDLQLTQAFTMVSKISPNLAFKHNGEAFFMLDERFYRKSVSLLEKIKEKLKNNVYLFKYSKNAEEFFLKNFNINNGKTKLEEKNLMVFLDYETKNKIVRSLKFKKAKIVLERVFDVKDVTVRGI